MIGYVITVAFVIFSSIAAADEPLPAALPPAAETAALEKAAATGLTLFRHDRAAALATDAVLELGAFEGDERVRGWITEATDDGVVVSFIDETPAALYRVVVSPNGPAGAVSVLETPVPLTSFERGALAAREAAIASTFEPCSEKYNTVVLPEPNSSGRWVVYLLPGTTRHDIVPIGGTYRMQVMGSLVESMRAFTRSCIALETDPKAEALFITHLLDPVPTEAHVFWSLWADKPLYVSTPPDGTVWKVDGKDIELVERDAAKR
jgi:hypothetical protein